MGFSFFNLGIKDLSRIVAVIFAALCLFIYYIIYIYCGLDSFLGIVGTFFILIIVGYLSIKLNDEIETTIKNIYNRYIKTNENRLKQKELKLNEIYKINKTENIRVNPASNRFSKIHQIKMIKNIIKIIGYLITSIIVISLIAYVGVFIMQNINPLSMINDQSLQYANDGAIKYNDNNVLGAQKDFLTALNLDSNNYMAYAGLGWVQYSLGNNSMAIHYFEKSINIHNIPNAHNGLGCVYTELGSNSADQEAINYYNKAMNNFTEALELDNRLLHI